MVIDLSEAPEGATHRSGANYYRKTGPIWMLFGSGGKWIATATDWSWLELNAESLELAWTGESPPPIGTVCEFHGAGAECQYDPWHPDLKDGDHVTIIAYFNDSVGQIAAFTFKARNENIAAIQVEQARPGAFRPIRTQEHIEEEEQYSAVEDMYRIFKDSPGLSAKEGIMALYKAGYRKQVTE